MLSCHCQRFTLDVIFLVTKYVHALKCDECVMFSVCLCIDEITICIQRYQ